jgi:hypothetical protein
VSDDGPQRRSTCRSRVHVSGWASLVSMMDSAKGGEVNESSRQKYARGAKMLVDRLSGDAGEIFVWEFCGGKERR